MTDEMPQFPSSMSPVLHLVTMSCESCPEAHNSPPVVPPFMDLLETGLHHYGP
ncbi:hypothetical protein GBAR_LOCUS19113 [Geodia barretti]|uniref:Uncharacterized protein n=1 Tax=Geodia barretti TaxID=519541 RepID=A0AA35SQ37_GEOBA|nr:hypothetical protein GBAR_LOCUS19113 [Geodia barretti]